MRSDITTRVEIDLDKVKRNFINVQNWVSPALVMAVLKGDGYGHGSVALAKALQEAGCKKCAVAELDEALELRKAGITMDIHTLGGLTRGQLETVVANDLIPFIPDLKRLSWIDRIAKDAGKRQRVHIKLDSGMGRLGMLPADVPAICDALLQTTNVEVEGAGTHLARAGGDEAFSRAQFERFLEGATQIEKALGKSIIKHVLASAGIVTYRDMWLQMVRPGSLVYGLSHVPVPEDLCIEPAMSLKTALVQVKNVPKGWNLGYGRVTAERDMTIGLIPMGRVDGFLPGSQGTVSVLVHEQLCKVLSIAADQTIIDLTAAPQSEVGDEVVVFGTQGTSEASVRLMGVQSGSSYGDIVMKISHRVPRIYFGGGHEIGEISLVARQSVD